MNKMDIEKKHSSELGRLIRLCYRGKTDNAKEILQQFKSIINAVDNDWTPLLSAASKGHYETVEMLLDQGADVNWTNRKGQNALFFACYKNHVDVAKLLLLNNADKEQCDLKDESTALIVAVKKDFIEIVKLLLCHRANVRHATKQRLTPLMVAAKYGASNQIVELLLKHSIETINDKDNKEWTALWHAIYQGNTETVKLLLNAKADVNTVNYIQQTALMLALTLSKLEIAEILVNHGADINYVDIDGNNALMLMSDSGNYDALQLLIKHEPDVDKTNSHGWTALMLAAQRGHAEIVQLLLTMSANIHQRSVEGFSALMLASLNAHSNVTDILLSFDANANERTMNDWTPLMLTSQLPNTLPCMKLLIEKGKADVIYINKYGWSALNIASFYGHDTIVEYLCLNGALHPVQNNQISALMLASFKGFPDVVKLLISCGSDVNQSNDAGITALMIAARFAKSDTVELLIELEASVNSLDTFHRTPLLHACSQGNWEVIDVLFKYGSDYTVVDKRGLNCLMCACEKGHLLVVKELVEKHKCDTNLNSEIDVNTLDLLSYCHSFSEKSNLITPSIITVNALTISAFCGHKECADYLLKFRHNSGTIDKSVLQVASKIGCHDLTAFEEKNNLAVLPSVSTKELSTLMQSCVLTDFVDKDIEFDSKTRTSSTNKPVLFTEKSPLELFVKMMSCIPPGFVPNLVLNILAPSGDIYIPQSTQCNVYAKNITNLAVDSVINSASSINAPLLRQESSSSTSLCVNAQNVQYMACDNSIINTSPIN